MPRPRVSGRHTGSPLTISAERLIPSGKESKSCFPAQSSNERYLDLTPSVLNIVPGAFPLRYAAESLLPPNHPICVIYKKLRATDVACGARR